MSALSCLCRAVLMTSRGTNGSGGALTTRHGGVGCSIKGGMTWRVTWSESDAACYQKKAS